MWAHFPEQWLVIEPTFYLTNILETSRFEVPVSKFYGTFFFFTESNSSLVWPGWNFATQTSQTGWPKHKNSFKYVTVHLY